MPLFDVLGGILSILENENSSDITGPTSKTKAV
jgi:hypothetical protein